MGGPFGGTNVYFNQVLRRFHETMKLSKVVILGVNRMSLIDEW